MTDEQDLEQHLERIKEDIRRLEFRTYRKETPKRDHKGESNHRSEDRLQMTKTLKNSSSLTISQQSDNFQSDSTIKTPKIHDRHLLKKIVDIIEKMFMRKKHKRQHYNMDSTKTKKKQSLKDCQKDPTLTDATQAPCSDMLVRQKKNRFFEPSHDPSAIQVPKKQKITQASPQQAAEGNSKQTYFLEKLGELEEGLKHKQDPQTLTDYKFLMHKKS